MSPRRRLDVELVRRGLVPSREQARELIEADRVTVGGAPASKCSRQVGSDEQVRVLPGPQRYVSRAGAKLEAALAAFDVVVEHRRALDAGASTGGFTDCLLRAGAREVIAVDVGYGQIDDRLRQDPRVRVFERVNIRSLVESEVRSRVLGSAGVVPLVVADLSFISLRVVADALLAVASDDGDLVVLVKPQFEAGRSEVSRGRGVIADPAVWARTVDEVTGAFAERGAGIMGGVVSPLRGAEGNVEFLVHLRRGALGRTDPLGRELAEQVHR